MAPSTIQHRRTHNILLISKLLNQRDASSPFTLILDNLEQSGQPLLAEYTQRAHAAKVKVIFLSFETLQRPQNVDIFIPAWSQSLQTWQREVATHTKPAPNQRNLLILDTLNPLTTTHSTTLPALLSTLLNPTTTLLALYHTDIPTTSSSSSAPPNPYAPTPLTLLRHLATTLITPHSLPHILARKAARERSVAAPVYGLEEGFEGVLQGRGANGHLLHHLDSAAAAAAAGDDDKDGDGKAGFVMEVEHRRKSGRGVREWYFVPTATTKTSTTPTPTTKEKVILLEDLPAYKSLSTPSVPAEGEVGSGLGEEGPEGTTFELGLTSKQREAREGVVLPYFDAQKGGGEGGRILYDMGEEDDFDEEEDEI